MYDCHGGNSLDCNMIACPLAVNLVNLERIKMKLNCKNLSIDEMHIFSIE